MNIKIDIQATELAAAINALALALSVKPEVKVTPEISATKEAVPSQEEVKEEPEKEVQEESKPVEETPVSKPEITLEAVRTKLTALSQSGKQVQVKELITSFGVAKLTDIPKDKFAEVLAAAEKL